MWVLYALHQAKKEKKTSQVYRLLSMAFLRMSVISVMYPIHFKWIKCATVFRKIEGQQIRQVVSLNERRIIEGRETKIWSSNLSFVKSCSLLFNIV